MHLGHAVPPSFCLLSCLLQGAGWCPRWTRWAAVAVLWTFRRQNPTRGADDRAADRADVVPSLPQAADRWNSLGIDESRQRRLRIAVDLVASLLVEPQDSNRKEIRGALRPAHLAILANRIWTRRKSQTSKHDMIPAAAVARCVATRRRPDTGHRR